MDEQHYALNADVAAGVRDSCFRQSYYLLADLLYDMLENALKNLEQAGQRTEHCDLKFRLNN